MVLAGDTNDLKLETILSLSPSLVQIVRKWTRMDPPAILDPIIMTLSNLYQEPLCLEPLDSDPDKNGKKSDHRIIISKPINVIENKCSRQTRTVTVRPFPQSGLIKYKEWISNQNWEEVYCAESAHEKAKIFQDLLVSKMIEIFPEKIRKIQSDDAPWISHKLKLLDRKRKRIYRKQRRSEKWRNMDKMFKKEVKLAKSHFYKQVVAELKLKKPGQWYTCLKKITSFHQEKREQQSVDEISHLPDSEQAEIIAEKFASIQNEYEALKTEDILIPHFEEKDIPQFHPSQVGLHLPGWLLTNKTICSIYCGHL